LASILLGKPVDDDKSQILEGVETVAEVTEGSIVIAIRMRTEDITQRLGTIELSHKEDEAISLFDWCGLATASTSTSTHDLSTLKSKFQAQKDAVTKLSAQLEELIAAKATHEAELLEKFRDLLNEKKSKIRDQQRLLASANVDPAKLAEFQAPTAAGTDHKAKVSRAGKRKAATAPEDEDSDEGFEKMDVDVDQVPNDSEEEEAQTQSENDATEDDDEMEAPAPPPPQKITSAPKAQPSERSRTPPRRDLPFAKKRDVAPAPPAPPAKPEADDADEETESEDDEL